MEVRRAEYCIRHIFREGFIFANFASRVLFANLTTHKNMYLWSRRKKATCVRNTSSTVPEFCSMYKVCVQYTVHVQNEWMILISLSIALLLDREFNHSRKCLEVPICEKFDSRNIWRIQYTCVQYLKLYEIPTGGWGCCIFQRKKKWKLIILSTLIVYELICRCMITIAWFPTCNLMPTEGRTGLEELGFLRDLAAQDNGTYRASAGDLDSPLIQVRNLTLLTIYICIL